MSSTYESRLHIDGETHDFQCQVRKLNLKDAERGESFAIEMCDLVNLCPLTVLPNLRNSTVLI